MKCEMTPPSQDAWILGLAIARAIQCSTDEKDALRRICTLLGFWEVKISPKELGIKLGGI